MRFEKTGDSMAGPAPVILIAALNIIFLSILLLFFHAHFSGPGYGIQAALVPVGGGSSAGEIIEIIVLQEGRVMVNGSALGLAELRDLLSRVGGRGERSFMVIAGKQVAFEQVVKVWDLCRQAGVRQLYLVTRE